MVLCQVNRFLNKQHFLKQLFRGAHDNSVSKILYPLETRKLLKISGGEASIFLQGLITNDMRHFEEGANSMYAMFLNNKGRVLYDTLIHKWHSKDTFILECDTNVVNDLQKHLKIFKLKRKVDITDVSTDFNLWVLISPGQIIDSHIDQKSKISVYKDPRLVDLGSRVVSATSIKKDEIKTVFGNDISIENSEEGYKYLRYKLGVSEGAEDLPPRSTFPLEANCDYLHGVSFHKGCYIGQELTARVHHTGVVRKRLMPLKFNEIVKELKKDSVISVSDKLISNIGKLKGFVYDYGLGLVRIKEGLEANALNVGQYTVEVLKPTWWPIEAPKEKVTTKE